MDGSERFSYFVLGLGLGTAVGLLFAPKSGRQTRNYLQAKAQAGTDYVKRQGGELRDRATENFERGKQSVRDQMHILGDAVDAGKQAYRDAVENIHSEGVGDPLK
jgi:gas vesicle protein